MAAGCGSGLLRLQPRVEVFLAAHVDDDRHEAVVAAAQFGALAAIDAGLVRVHLEPGLVDVARDRVLLDRQCRHPPGVDDVLRPDQQAHLGAGRHHQRVVDAQQVVLDLVRIAARTERARRIAGTIERGEEAHALVHVLVLPLPLVAGHADRELGAGGILHLDQRPRGRHGHGDEDQHRDHRPDHLGLGVVQQLGVRHRAGRFSEAHQRIDHPAEDEHADPHAPPEHQHVDGVGAARDLADARRHIQRPGGMRCRRSAAEQGRESGGNCRYVSMLHH